MNKKFEYFKKRYNLNIVEKDGEIIEIYAIREEGNLPFKKEENGWVLKQPNSAILLPY